MTDRTKALEAMRRLLTEMRIAHGNQPISTWQDQIDDVRALLAEAPVPGLAEAEQIAWDEAERQLALFDAGKQTYGHHAAEFIAKAIRNLKPSPSPSPAVRDAPEQMKAREKYARLAALRSANDCECNPHAEETCPLTMCPRLRSGKILIEQNEALTRWDQRNPEGRKK